MLLNCIFARMTQADVAIVKDLLAETKTIVVVPHLNPDGDAIGSALGLAHYLTKKGHETRIIAPNDFPNFLKWMPGVEDILIFDRDRKISLEYLEKADIIFTLDFNDLNRTGEMGDELENSDATFIMIDHHREPKDYAKVMYSDVSMSSTCEMVYNFILATGQQEDISQAIATCLYTGILTDTGSFRFASTTSQTHRVVADLMDRGAENAAIYNRIFNTDSPNRLRLLGTALNNLVILPEFGTAYITLSQEELDRNEYKKGDTEGFVNYGLTLKNIEFAAIFIENRADSIIKISFRSQGSFSVNDFARAHFNGGGHTNAAGGRSTLSLEETVVKFRSLLHQYKDQLHR